MKTNYLLTFLCAFVVCMSSCRKDSYNKASMSDQKITVNASHIPDSMITTPAGLMLKSRVHEIQNGFHLEIKHGHMLKIETVTGKLAEDFGLIKANVTTSRINNIPAPSDLRKNAGLANQRSIIPSGNGWQASTLWQNTGSEPINSFSTTWSVPGSPSTSAGQTIYVWMGLSNGVYSSPNASALLIQPVMEWGTGRSK